MTDDEIEQRATPKEAHEALETQLFTPSPEGFIPVEASHRELEAYGFPPQPNEEAHPELYEHWKQIMSQPMSVIRPQFAAISGPTRGSRQAREATAGTGWAGSSVSPQEGDVIAFVSGQWTVPHVVDPGARQHRNACATWIGIDGGDPDILQAGTTQSVHPLNQPYGPGLPTFAWHQWYIREKPQAISNFPVSPGDIIYCVISVRSPTEGAVFMLNVTTGVYTSFIKHAPAGIRLVRNYAEWVLESPSDGSLGELPKYGEVYFDWCFAGTRDHELLFGGDGTLMDMDSRDFRISVTNAVSDRLITITYTGQP